MSVPLEFLDALRNAGIPPADPSDVHPGRLVRYRIDGDRAGSRNGWAVIHLHPVPAGASGSWKHGIKGTWRAEVEPLSDEDREDLARRIEEERVARRRADARRRAEAADRARRIWRESRPANPEASEVAAG